MKSADMNGTQRGPHQNPRCGTGIEGLLAADRLAALPELPEPDFTTAAVARRLAARDVAAHPPRTRLAALHHLVQTPAAVPEAVLWVGAATTATALAGYALLHGVSPWWLLAEPLALLPLVPILHKGVH